MSSELSTKYSVPSTKYSVLSTKNFPFFTKKAQSEMVGFVLIIIIVAVVILVFLSLSSNKIKNTEIESYELESFISSSLEYTTNCFSNSDFVPLRRLIYECVDNKTCQNGIDACEEMEKIWENLVNSAWIVSPEAITKGIELNVTSKGESIYSIFKGNVTAHNKMSVQSFDSGVQIFFKTYY